jgi:hypothetical protein
MEAIKIFEQYWEQLKRLAIYAQYCVENDVHAPVCRNFWTWSIVAAFGIAILIIALIAKRVIKEQLEFRRNRKRLEARAIVASEEEIDAAAWKGDALKGDLESLPVEHLADKFREALNKEGKPPTPS